MEDFSRQYASTYALPKRNLAGLFEIGCFLGLIRDYERQGATLELRYLVAGEYRYLTTPNGNPHNFSYVRVAVPSGTCELRQQVRIRSHLHEDVNFTPDMVVVQEGAQVMDTRDLDFAKGKRGFFRVSSAEVIAAHECKSMTGFPELYVSFVGTLLVAHSWVAGPAAPTIVRGNDGHLAPTLFVGGVTANLHRRMIAALEASFPLNVVTGVHQGGWVLENRELQRRPFDAVTRPPDSGAAQANQALNPAGGG